MTTRLTQQSYTGIINFAMTCFIIKYTLASLIFLYLLDFLNKTNCQHISKSQQRHTFKNRGSTILHPSQGVTISSYESRQVHIQIQSQRELHFGQEVLLHYATFVG